MRRSVAEDGRGSTRKGKKRVGIQDALFSGYNTENAGTVGRAGKKVWNALTLERLNEVVEQTSRYVEYKYGTAQKDTTAGKQQAFRNSQEVSVSFKRRKSTARARNEIHYSILQRFPSGRIPERAGIHFRTGKSRPPDSPKPLSIRRFCPRFPMR